MYWHLIFTFKKFEIVSLDPSFLFQDYKEGEVNEENFDQE
jgi:hypothetical protein